MGASGTVRPTHKGRLIAITNNEVFSCTAVTLAGNRYQRMLADEMRKLDAEWTWQGMLRVTYLKGLYDMSVLGTVAKSTGQVADELRRIDRTIEEMGVDRADGEVADGPAEA